MRTLSCDGTLLVPVGSSLRPDQRGNEGHAIPTVLFGRVIDDHRFDTVAIDNMSAARQAVSNLLDLGHRDHHRAISPNDGSRAPSRIARRHGGPRPDAAAGSCTLRGVQGRRRLLDGWRDSRRTGSSERDLRGERLHGPRRDEGARRCRPQMSGRPSVATRDMIPGIGGLRPRLTRTEHPVSDMVAEALRLLLIGSCEPAIRPRRVVFQPALIVGESCAPVRG